MSAHLPPAAPPGPPPIVPDDINYDDFITEDDTPVDGIYSEKQQRLLTEPLYASWPGPGAGRKFLAMTNVGLFWEPKKPPIVPDSLLSLDVEIPDDMWTKKNRSYFTWVYGKNPEVVIEVVSNDEGGELSEKVEIYKEIGIRYYVVWDPENHLGKKRLTAFRLQGGNYRPMRDLWFEECGLGLKIWHGSVEGNDEDWLRWCEKNGEVILTGSEGIIQESQRAEQEKHRAEQEKCSAQNARKSADQEKQRADRLAAQLRALGVEPDA